MHPGRHMLQFIAGSVLIKRLGGAHKQGATNLPVCFSTPPDVKRSKNSIDVTVQDRRSALTAPAAPDADQDTLPLLQRRCCCTASLLKHCDRKLAASPDAVSKYASYENLHA